MKITLSLFGLLLIGSSALADSNLICGVFKDLPAGAPAFRLVTNLDNDGMTGIQVNADLTFTVYVHQNNVNIGFSRAERAMTTVFSGSKRILKLMNTAGGESIGSVDTDAPSKGTLSEHFGVCYYTGNETKAPFDP